jgi:hypothetical protein
VAKRLQIKQKATETKSHIFVRNHKTEFLEHTFNLLLTILTNTNDADSYITFEYLHLTPSTCWDEPK